MTSKCSELVGGFNNLLANFCLKNLLVGVPIFPINGHWVHGKIWNFCPPLLIFPPSSRCGPSFFLHPGRKDRQRWWTLGIFLGSSVVLRMPRYWVSRGFLGVSPMQLLKHGDGWKITHCFKIGDTSERMGGVFQCHVWNPHRSWFKYVPIQKMAGFFQSNMLICCSIVGLQNFHLRTNTTRIQVNPSTGLDFRWGFEMGVSVSKNRGTPKWMVYDGKPY